MLALLIVVPLIIAAIVTLWSIKQIAYRPKKTAPPKPVLSTAEAAGSAVAGVSAAASPPAATASADCETADSKGRCRH
jgi:uncharacterized membrane protein YfcA